MPAPDLVSARLFSFVPAPPKVPPNVLVPEAMPRVRVLLAAAAPTTLPPRPVVARPARVWLRAVADSPITSLPDVDTSPSVTVPVVARRSLPPVRASVPFLTEVRPV